METGSSEQEVREKVCEILEEMSQNLQLRFIRLMAYTCTKVFKKLFSAIFVNMDGLSAVSSPKQQLLSMVLERNETFCTFGHKLDVTPMQ